MNFKRIILVLASLTTGLNAGIFFDFQVSIIPAFKILSNHDYIAAMQAINVAILNPVFLSNFTGSAILLPVAWYLHRGKPTLSKWLLAASLLYIVGSFGVTSAFNVPLNDMIAQFPLESSTPQQMAAMRTAFEDPWNTWHLVRTLASIGAFVLVTAPFLSAGERSMQDHLSEKRR